MAVSGTINVSLSAIDTYTTDGVDAEKKVAVSSAVNLSSAAVLTVSGTCGTSGVSVSKASEYRGADGELVSFGVYSNTARIAFTAEPAAQINWDNSSSFAPLQMTSRNGDVAISSYPNFLNVEPNLPLEVKTVATAQDPNPTASFTVVFIKEA